MMPLPKMLPLLTDEAAESQELQPCPALWVPPGPQQVLPNAAALHGARGLTHCPGDSGAAGHLPIFSYPKPLGALPLSPTGDSPRGPPEAPQHLLVAPASVPSASKAVRWLRSGPMSVPGLSLVLSTRCRGSVPCFAAGVSRADDDTWKKSSTGTQCLLRLPTPKAEGHAGAQTRTQDAFVLLLADARGRRGAAAGSGHCFQHSQTRKALGGRGWVEGGGGHESKRRPLAGEQQLAGSAATDYSTGQCLLEINNSPSPFLLAPGRRMYLTVRMGFPPPDCQAAFAALKKGRYV